VTLQCATGISKGDGSGLFESVDSTHDVNEIEKSSAIMCGGGEVARSWAATGFNLSPDFSSTVVSL
jgi:hypothetical protein